MKQIIFAFLLIFLGIFIKSYDQPKSEAQTLQTAIQSVVKIDRDCSAVHLGQGKLLTANHCVANRKMGYYTTSLFNGKEIKETFYYYDVVKRDEANDLATLQLRDKTLLPSVKIAEGIPLEGEKVFAIGYPANMSRTVSEGRFGEIEYIHEEKGWVEKIRSTTTIFSGNSGGGLFYYEKGEWKLVGTVVSTFFYQGQVITHMTFSTPQYVIKKLVQ